MAILVTCETCKRVFRVPNRVAHLPVAHACAPRPLPPNAPLGPGSQLLRILRVAHWFVGKSCGCESYAAQMDAWGVLECERRLEEIVAHLVKQADDKILLASFVPGTTKEALARRAAIEAIDLARQSAARDRIEYLTLRQLSLDVQTLVGRLPPDVGAVVGVPRSGMIPASQLACLLHVPLLAFSADGLSDPGHGYRLNPKRIPPGRLLVVDDTIQTGYSIRQAKKRWRSARLPDALWCAMYVSPRQVREVDYLARELRAPHYLEWNWPNSMLLPKIAMDFDGVLCRDLAAGADRDDAQYHSAIAEALPLYLPRRESVPLVVTARTEAMREVTEAWLARWGVRVANLVMWPGSRDSRNANAVAGWKAEHYAASPCHLFVESDRQLAQKIHAATGKPVLCPASETIYQ